MKKKNIRSNVFKRSLYRGKIHLTFHTNLNNVLCIRRRGLYLISYYNLWASNRGTLDATKTSLVMA